ncbi:unnamed protein product [Phytophthora fragariaefolia]|uniref:Unnamed protein product n=1 Tax=Phytophthora fragariaefolia TaxID=1490495 RepID=A0A9W6XJE2_9STRA|nr:unnamed protein product [Phytophthora fragariaefolia]
MLGRSSQFEGLGSTSEDSGDCSPTSNPKKRKPTYIIRKVRTNTKMPIEIRPTRLVLSCMTPQEQEKILRDEILHLEAQVAVLTTQGMPVGSSLAADPVLQQAKAKSKVLADTVKQQQLAIASTQSLMTECIKEWVERRATLLAIREQKLKNAYDYVISRSRRTPGGQNQNSRELLEGDNGNIYFLGSTVVNFRGVRSLRQVFEALWFYLTNMEISISERLGNITVREDYDMIEGSAYNARIMSSDSNGITTESNTVVFGQLFENGDPRFGDEPCALVASDCVDKDELYPYRSSEHVRKDISGGVVLTASRQKVQPPHGKCGDLDSSLQEEEIVVTMRRTGYLKLHHPEFPVPPFVRQELVDGIDKWGQVMINTMRDVLYGQT